jgi:xanthine dehydrogenase small subunit
MTATPSFRLNGRDVAADAGTPPTTTLLDWLRGPQRLTGTKEGCAEGDCGACTVVIEEPSGGRTPINACLVTLGQLHGRAIRTVEGLGGTHPVQRAMAESDGTQCGFCTPGIVMSAWAYTAEGGNPHEALAGNLCRCTGYRPILDAMEAMPRETAAPFEAPAAESARFGGYHLPATLAEALALRAAHPEAWLLAGGTDLGLRFSEHREHPAQVICLLNVPELQSLHASPEGWRIGAAVSYARLLKAVEDDAAFAGMREYLARLGSRQIRGLGSIGGNLGTASPIGDALPVLLALDATVTLASQRGERVPPVGEFLLGYRRNALAPDEIIREIFLPRPQPGAIFVAEKLSKRHDQDISTVSLAALVTVRDGVVAEARLAFGGMAATAKRATAAEATLLGAPWSAASLDAAATALAGDFTPMSDWRGSAAYRSAAAAGLLRRLWWRAQGEVAEVHGLEAPHAPAFLTGAL